MAWPSLLAFSLEMQPKLLTDMIESIKRESRRNEFFDQLMTLNGLFGALRVHNNLSLCFTHNINAISAERFHFWIINHDFLWLVSVNIVSVLSSRRRRRLRDDVFGKQIKEGRR